MVVVKTIARRRVGVNTPTGQTSVRRVRPYRARIVVRPQTQAETFADRLLRLRIERGLTQPQLADLTRLSKSSISDCEQGRLAGVTAHTVAELARGLGVSMDELWNGEAS